MIEFKLDDKNYVLKKPSSAQKQDSNKIYNKEFRECVRSGCFLRAQINSLALEQGIWDTEEDNKYRLLQTQISGHERALKKGGIPLENAKKIALELRNLRFKLMELVSKINSLDSQSAEFQSETARNNYLVSVCLYEKDSTTPYCSSYDWFIENCEDDMVLVSAVLKWNLELNNLNKHFFDNLPENKFMSEYGFKEDDQEEVIEEEVIEFIPFTQDGEPVNPILENQESLEVEEEPEKPKPRKKPKVEK